MKNITRLPVILPSTTLANLSKSCPTLMSTRVAAVAATAAEGWIQAASGAVGPAPQYIFQAGR